MSLTPRAPIDGLPELFLMLNDDWKTDRNDNPISRCCCRHGIYCAYNNGSANRIFCDSLLGNLENMSVFCFTRPCRDNASGVRVVMAPPLIEGHEAIKNISPELKRAVESSHRYVIPSHSNVARCPKRPRKLMKAKQRVATLCNQASKNFNARLSRITDVVSNSNCNAQQRQCESSVPSVDGQGDVPCSQYSYSKIRRRFKCKNDSLNGYKCA